MKIGRNEHPPSITSPPSIRDTRVPVFYLSRASRAGNDESSPHYRHAENQKNEAAAVENSAIYAKCDDEVITHEIGVTDDPLQKFKGFVDLEKRTIDPVAMVGAS